AAPEASLREELLSTEAGPRRRARLEGHVREQVARVLRLAPARVEADRPLRALGLDSLMAIELRNRLEASLGVPVPATAIWNYPTVGALVPFLAQRMEVPLEGTSPPAAYGIIAVPAAREDGAALAVEAITDEEAEAMLLDELDSLDMVGG
ncbi:MAG TPA: acyl carrier protein, partial [Longimicrobiaceae bacterium]|nr:acyl carrier protein [Longimicrobiaceae bacterium]